MLTVMEVSRRSGISVRTLHYYDQIGLLEPAQVTEAGYRIYDEESLKRLHTILIYRELQFPLKEIRRMLDSPDYDPQEALAQQIRLLEQQYKRTGRLLALAYDLKQNGLDEMDFRAFDRTEMECYKEEAKARWGQNDACREYAQRVLQKTDQELRQSGEALMQAMMDIASLKALPPSEECVQEKVKALQQCMNQNYYTCTDEILAAFGQTLVDNIRFACEIDQSCGDGAAQYLRDAICTYCQKKNAKVRTGGLEGCSPPSGSC